MPDVQFQGKAYMPFYTALTRMLLFFGNFESSNPEVLRRKSKLSFFGGTVHMAWGQVPLFSNRTIADTMIVRAKTVLFSDICCFQLLLFGTLGQIALLKQIRAYGFNDRSNAGT